MILPQRRTEALYRHRWAAPGVRYFLTMCVADRQLGLTSIQDPILKRIQESVHRGDTDTFAFTIMPDHVHWLFQCGERLSLGRIVGRFKVDTRKELAKAGLEWQRDFFEHWLRSDESIEAYARYIFLNPYRAGLLGLRDSWPGWLCPNPQRMEFLTQMGPEGEVPREWIGDEEDVAEGWGEKGWD